MAAPAPSGILKRLSLLTRGCRKATIKKARKTGRSKLLAKQSVQRTPRINIPTPARPVTNRLRGTPPDLGLPSGSPFVEDLDVSWNGVNSFLPDNCSKQRPSSEDQPSVPFKGAPFPYLDLFRSPLRLTKVFSRKNRANCVFFNQKDSTLETEPAVNRPREGRDQQSF